METDEAWELLVKEQAVKLAMRDIVVRLGITPHHTRMMLVVAALEMIRSDPKWIEQAKEQLCQMNSKPL